MIHSNPFLPWFWKNKKPSSTLLKRSERQKKESICDRSFVSVLSDQSKIQRVHLHRVTLILIKLHLTRVPFEYIDTASQGSIPEYQVPVPYKANPNSV
jgi:hypothetical protein